MVFATLAPPLNLNPKKDRKRKRARTTNRTALSPTPTAPCATYAPTEDITIPSTSVAFVAPVSEPHTTPLTGWQPTAEGTVTAPAPTVVGLPFYTRFFFAS